MSEKYLEIFWQYHIPEEEVEILVSLLDHAGFNSFYEDENVFRAYIEKTLFNEVEMLRILSFFNFSFPVNDFVIFEMPDKNWNELWEKKFNPVQIGGFLTIKAPFHTISSRTEYEIIIEPKMSFGTGHHETTSGMLEMMHTLDFKERKVIDMGCGTGILAVFAEILGARSVVAIDNDPVCIDNSIEIIKLNDCQNIVVKLGDASVLEEIKCDIFLANINRNILLNDIRNYRRTLSSGGLLMMSGFYSDDLGMIDEECKKHGFEAVSHIKKNNWIICLYKIM